MERFDRVGGLEECFYEPKESNVRIRASESATRDSKMGCVWHRPESEVQKGIY